MRQLDNLGRDEFNAIVGGFRRPVFRNCAQRAVNSSIDEPTAWRLVRAISPGSVRPETPLRVSADAADDVWLEVDTEGTWQASATPLEGARDIFELYLPLQVRDRLVIGQLGQSLDGRIATVAGHSQFITGLADICRLHRLRALVDAVIVGASTIAADDPQLTVRKTEGENPVRVVLDPNDRLDPNSKVFTDGAAPTIVLRQATNGREPRSPSSDVIELPVAGEQGFDPCAVLSSLRQRGLNRVLVEGGGITVSRFLQAGVLDRLHVAVAPLLLGSGCRGIVLEPIETLDQALRPRARHFSLGDDVVFDLDLS